MKHIALFGGSFNPIHLGHLAVAREVLREALADEVWFLVSPMNPFKHHVDDLIDDRSRLLLVQKALDHESSMRASDYEFHLPKPSYTWTTLTHLSAENPAIGFRLLIGADNWLAFDRWAHADDILAHHQLIVYPRKGYLINEQTLPRQVRLLHCPLYPISSSDIRKRLHEGLSVHGLVPPAIEGLLSRFYN